ncbi:MAG TPA: hypothetical protein PLS66_04785 [Tepiditoga sp.]|nr:hypothetical protein [Tepiditoga sp.]
MNKTKIRFAKKIIRYSRKENDNKISLYPIIRDVIKDLYKNI